MKVAKDVVEVDGRRRTIAGHARRRPRLSTTFVISDLPANQLESLRARRMRRGDSSLLHTGQYGHLIGAARLFNRTHESRDCRDVP